VLLLKTDRLRNFLGQSKDQRDYVLGYHRPVDVAGIGEDRIAIHEFGKQKLVYRSRGRVNPLKLSSRLKLFGTEGEGEGYFGVGDIVLKVFKIVDPNNFELRKIPCESFREPLRGDPEIEAVGSCYQNLHRVIGRSGHRVIFIIYPPYWGKRAKDVVQALLTFR
jgi:hypothetical protein